MSGDNPPAFPNNGSYGHSGQYLPEGGMTLRDWFAGQAIAAIITVTSAGQHHPGRSKPDASTLEGMALDAYELADAMLATRQQEK